MAVEPSASVRAYDALAPVYDSHLVADVPMRRLLWSRYDALFAPGDRVLDLGCGTATDAIHLAARGVHVLGIDSSPGMIERAYENVARAGLEGCIELMVLDAGALASLGESRFDGVISAFAALNTLPSMATVASDAARLLVPGGRFLIHVLNPCSIRQWLGLIARRRWPAARALGRARSRTFNLNGVPVTHYLESGDVLYTRDFAPNFRLDRMYGIGILPVPRFDVRVAARVSRLDGLIGRRRPFVGWGRFVVLEMTRQEVGADY